MSKNLVIVESPAKAKTIKKYLGKDFEVLASYGHVRDLVPKEGAVNPDADFAMKYQVIERNSKHVDAIVKAMKKADDLYLATDPDREEKVAPVTNNKRRFYFAAGARQPSEDGQAAIAPRTLASGEAPGPSPPA